MICYMFFLCIFSICCLHFIFLRVIALICIPKAVPNESMFLLVIRMIIIMYKHDKEYNIMSNKLMG